MPTATGSEAILAAVTASSTIEAVTTALVANWSAPTASSAILACVTASSTILAVVTVPLSGVPIVSVMPSEAITSIDTPFAGAVLKVSVFPETE